MLMKSLRDHKESLGSIGAKNLTKKNAQTKVQSLRLKGITRPKKSLRFTQIFTKVIKLKIIRPKRSH